jgi:molecular chaperone DnaK
MISKAEKYKNEDKKRRELVDIKNEADNTLHNTEKSLTEHRSKIPVPDAEEIERECGALRSLIAENLIVTDIPRLKDQIEKV